MHDDCTQLWSRLQWKKMQKPLKPLLIVLTELQWALSMGSGFYCILLQPPFSDCNDLCFLLFVSNICIPLLLKKTQVSGKGLLLLCTMCWESIPWRCFCCFIVVKVVGQWLTEKTFYLPPGSPPGCEWVSIDPCQLFCWHKLKKRKGEGVHWKNGDRIWGILLPWRSTPELSPFLLWNFSDCPQPAHSIDA